MDERFEYYIERSSDPDQCWGWNGPKNHSYGVLGSGYSDVRVHRLVWEKEFGPIPEGMQVCHSCDNPPCCNPRHLFLGTQADNNADKESKGRGTKPPKMVGIDHFNAKLTDSDILDIQQLLEWGMLQRSIGVRYGVHQTLISLIKGRKIWTHVLPPPAPPADPGASAEPPA